jgi:hypothetical protein
MAIFDNKDLYPTPEEYIIKMIGDENLSGKVILEPHIGTGNIVKVVKEMGGTVIGCEASHIVDNFLKEDFLQVSSEEISHIDYIIMNPPFSVDDKHLLHAWEIAPGGCKILSLCNWETIDNCHTKRRVQLKDIINDYGIYENLGSIFSTAERTTNVQVGFVKLFKEKVGEDTFDDYFDMEEDYEQDGSGIMPYNVVREIVNRYVGSVRLFKEVQAASDKINSMSSIFSHCDISFGAYKRRETNYTSISFEEYKKELQKAAWKTVFAKMNMHKYVTQKLKEELNKFVETQGNVPFRMSNVYKMIHTIAGTHNNRMEQALVDCFDRATKHYDDNRHNIEGWKTNSHFMVNKTIIFPYVVHRGYSGQMEVIYNSQQKDLMEDLCKALCHLTGYSYDENCVSLEVALQGTRKPLSYYQNSEEYQAKAAKYYDNLKEQHFGKEPMDGKDVFIEKEIIRNFKDGKEKDYKEWGKWHDWNFFQVRGYKKGSMHFKFKDEKVWELFNRKVGDLKGHPLPEKI